MEHETKTIEIRPDPQLKLDRDDARAFILNVEDRIKALPGAIVGHDADEICPLTHRFAPGVYCREINIPKGMLLVGKIHKHAHPNFLLKGEVSYITETGGVKRVKAPQTMISPAGTKRIVYTHEDTVWTTVHVTNETDPDIIEEEVIAKTYEQLDDATDKQLIEELTGSLNPGQEV